MFNDLANKAFRIAFLAENIKAGLAFQIRALRERAGMSQPRLAEEAGKTQSVISRLENPNYGSYTIRTLLDLARAFDVALLIKFVPYSRLIAETQDLSPEALAVDNYTQERDRQQQSTASMLTGAYQSAFISGQMAPDVSYIRLTPPQGSLASIGQNQSHETTVNYASASDMAFPSLGPEPEGKGVSRPDRPCLESRRDRRSG